MKKFRKSKKRKSDEEGRKSDRQKGQTEGVRAEKTLEEVKMAERTCHSVSTKSILAVNGPLSVWHGIRRGQ